MATTQESLHVASFEIRLLADDNAPDAESAYFVWRRYDFVGTQAEARAEAATLIRLHRLCGCEIYLADVMVESFLGFFDDDGEEYESPRSEHDD